VRPPGADAQFLLTDVSLYQPAITKCATPDVVNNSVVVSSVCAIGDTRSDGCVAENLNCQLALVLGYSSGDFLTFTTTLFSAFKPNTQDGKMNVTVTYTSSGTAMIFALRGFLQLWQYTSTTNTLDNYVYAGREAFVDQLASTNPLPIYTFNDVYAGKYMLVYWDTGGTRFGSGIPETSAEFTVNYVFPDIPIGIQLGPAHKNPYAPPTACMYPIVDTGNSHDMTQEYYSGKYFNIWPDKNVFFMYNFVGLEELVDLSTYVANMVAVHNRKLVWRIVSEMGNNIDVKTDPLPTSDGYAFCDACNSAGFVNMTAFCNYCYENIIGWRHPACAQCAAPPSSNAGATFCDSGGGWCNPLGIRCQTRQSFIQDSMLYYKVVPMITGSYGTATGDPVVPDPLGDNPNGYFPWTRDSQGKKWRVMLTMTYTGFAGNNYEEYWRMRQMHPDATIIDSRMLDMIQINALPVWGQLTDSTSGYNDDGSISPQDRSIQAMYRYAHLEFGTFYPQIPSNEDYFVTYYYPYHGTKRGYGGAGGQIAMFADYFNWADQYRGINGQDHKKNFCESDIAEGYCDLLTGELFKFNITFAEHYNHDDWSCHPVGTNYAMNAEYGNHLHRVENEADPFIEYQGPIYSPSDYITGPGSKHYLFPKTLTSGANYGRFTFADIRLGNENAKAMFTNEYGTCGQYGSNDCNGGASYVTTDCYGLSGTVKCCETARHVTTPYTEDVYQFPTFPAGPGVLPGIPSCPPPFTFPIIKGAAGEGTGPRWLKTAFLRGANCAILSDVCCDVATNLFSTNPISDVCPGGTFNSPACADTPLANLECCTYYGTSGQTSQAKSDILTYAQVCQYGFSPCATCCGDVTNMYGYSHRTTAACNGDDTCATNGYQINTQTIADMACSASSSIKSQTNIYIGASMACDYALRLNYVQPIAAMDYSTYLSEYYCADTACSNWKARDPTFNNYAGNPDINYYLGVYNKDASNGWHPDSTNGDVNQYDALPGINAHPSDSDLICPTGYGFPEATCNPSGTVPCDIYTSCTPGNIESYYINANKDCAAGMFIPFYKHSSGRENLEGLVEQLSFPYYQMKLEYASRATMLENEINQPIFLIPGFNDNFNNNFAAPIPTQALYTQSPVVWTFGQSNALNRGTLGLDTHTVSIQYEQNVLPGTRYNPGPFHIPIPGDYYYYNGNDLYPDDYSTLKAENENDADVVSWSTMAWASYARFLQYPTPVFRQFKNAVPARGALPALIDVEFRLSCPFLGFRQYGEASTPAPCAEGWYITNQYNHGIVVAAPQGTIASDSDGLSIAAYTHLTVGSIPLANQILGPGYDGDVWVVTVVLTDGDILHWEFNTRSSPEKPFGTAAGVCYFSTADQRAASTGPLYYVPDTVFVTVPLSQYIFLPLDVYVSIAPAACVYDQPEMLVFVVRGTFFAWLSVVDLNLPGIGAAGAPSGVGVNNQFAYYYYSWTLINQSSAGTDINIQGFDQQFQLYSPPFTVTVCDVSTCITPTTFNFIPPPPTVENPLRRPPRCTVETINNATCSINLADLPGYSGINQEPFCRPSLSGGPSVNAVLLTPRLIFNPPYTQLDNVGAVKFSVATAYIDPLFYQLTHSGQTEQDSQYVVDENGFPSGSVWISLWVNYGLTVASHFEPFCYDDLLAHVYIASTFVVSPGVIQRVAGCSRTDNCCYFLPLVVAGTSPFTGLPTILTGTNFPYNQPGNTTDLCYNSPVCIYEVIVTPPYNVDGGICLGQTYEFTVQTPQALVDVREGPPITIGNTTIYNVSDFHFAYRCPTTFTYALPIGGFSPASVSTVPGTCTEPGTAASFGFQYTEPECTGPISVNNPVPACRKVLYFALANQNTDPTYPNSCPDPSANSEKCFSLGSPYPITGIYAFTYNAPGLFEFPNFFTPSGTAYTNGGFPAIPNGYWNAYFWIQDPLPVSSANGYNVVVDGRQKMTVPFEASLANTVGLEVVRTFFRIPPCPGPPMQLGFIVTDLAWSGFYIATWSDPFGGVISQQNFTCGALPCFGSCQDICPQCANTNPAQTQTNCDQYMQTIGISLTAQVGTGAQSPGIQGGYTLSVFGEKSECGSQYTEPITPLNAFSVQISCSQTTCAGGGDANVNLEVTGGTQIPPQPPHTVQGSHLDSWSAEYYFNWTTPEGYLITPDLLRVPQGLYQVNITDFNGCMPPPLPSGYSAQCVVNASESEMSLIPAGSVPPNCSGNVGTAHFRVVGGTPPYTLERISNNAVVVATGYTILSDTSALPGVDTLYIVIDAKGCVSPEISFTLGGPIQFMLSVSADYQPCALAATGRLLAEVSPVGLGTVLEWTNVNTGQVVYNNADNAGYPFLDNAPAGTYMVTATAVLYGCVKTAFYTLHAQTPPIITVVRTEVSTFVDRILGTVVSDNGPPYTITFFGLVPNPPTMPPWEFTPQLFGDSEQFLIAPLPATETFDITVTDRGNCSNTYQTRGRTITQAEILQTPTALPHRPPPNQSAEIETLLTENEPKNLKLLVVVLSVVSFSVLAFAVFYTFYR
jgi:hypothetical protein